MAFKSAGEYFSGKIQQYPSRQNFPVSLQYNIFIKNDLG